MTEDMEYRYEVIKMPYNVEKEWKTFLKNMKKISKNNISSYKGGNTMRFKSEAEVELIKKMYPVGCKIVVDYMNDPQAPASGTEGTVYLVDSMGQVHCEEFGLALIPDVDRFHKV